MLLNGLWQILQEVPGGGALNKLNRGSDACAGKMGASVVPTLKLWGKQDSGVRNQERGLHASLG